MAFNSEKAKDNERIRLGSGKLYCMEFSGTFPEFDEIEKESNLFGYILGGATLDYQPTYYTVEDDSETVSKTVVTAESATLTSGLLTWNMKSLNKMVQTGRVTEKDGIRILKIGGAKNMTDTNYVLLFVHSDPSEGKTWVGIVGKNTEPISLAFAKDKETVNNLKFSAKSLDSDGTKVILAEEIPTT